MAKGSSLFKLLVSSDQRLTRFALEVDTEALCRKAGESYAELVLRFLRDHFDYLTAAIDCTLQTPPKRIDEPAALREKIKDVETLVSGRSAFQSDFLRLGRAVREIQEEIKKEPSPARGRYEDQLAKSFRKLILNLFGRKQGGLVVDEPRRELLPSAYKRIHGMARSWHQHLIGCSRRGGPPTKQPPLPLEQNVLRELTRYCEERRYHLRRGGLDVRQLACLMLAHVFLPELHWNPRRQDLETYADSVYQHVKRASKRAKRNSI